MNHNDYHLDEMENAAVNKSKNLKRGLAIGAGVLGVGGTAVAGTTHYMHNHESADSPVNTPLSEEDILAVANAGGIEDTTDNQSSAQTSASGNTHHVDEVHVTQHIVVDDPNQNVQPTQDVIVINENGMITDEEGNIISLHESGTYNGMDYVVFDRDLNGKGDLLAIDENRNGVIEDHEIHQLDNKSYELNHPREMAWYVQTEEGDIVNTGTTVNVNDLQANNNFDPEPEIIHNDFDDERTGEIYRGDLAENNPDYYNRGGEQYSAEMENPIHDNELVAASSEIYTEESQDVDVYVEPTESYAYNDQHDDAYTESDDYGYTEPENYGYSDPADNLASYESDAETFVDDPIV